MAETRKRCEVRARMEKWLSRQGMTPETICIRLGYAGAYWKCTPTPNINFVEQFLAYFPRLSSEYIMRGTGEMERAASPDGAMAVATQTLEERLRDKDMIIDLLKKQLAIYESLTNARP